MNIEAEARL